MHARKLGREIGAAERDREEEAQCDGRVVHARCLHAALGLVNLIAAQVLGSGRIRRAAQELGKSLDLAKIIVLRLLAELADRHVLDHATAQWADGCGSGGGHRRLP
jgi:hypothetical protein